jgi:hypothetical protein
VSIQAVSDLAVARDVGEPGSETARPSETLIKTIPTESLTAYTAFIALVQTQATAADELVDWRWGAFVGFLVLTVVAVLAAYHRKAASARPSSVPDDQHWGRRTPFELVPVLLAAMAWGLAMPGGPLSALITGAAGALVLGAVVIGGGALVTLTAAPLRTATATPPTEEPAPGDPADPLPA